MKHYLVMADSLLLRAVKGQAKNLNLSNKGLTSLPKIIGKVKPLQTLILKGNRLKELPQEIIALLQLENINLGNNNFDDIPEVIGFLFSLVSLHLFNNSIHEVRPTLFNNLENLKLLNLNNNSISVLPREINRLSSLEYLSIDNNCLDELPIEVCHLSKLIELHAASNRLICLPHAIAFLGDLKKLYVQKNFISLIPEGLSKCMKLEVFDISCNQVEIFPNSFASLPIKELYCEQNNLLRHLPVKSLQDVEVLSLKEIVARFILTSLRDSSSLLRIEVRYNQKAQDVLSSAKECCICGKPFLDTWLECVRFVDAKKVIGTKNNCGIIPLRGLLCTYQCFNSEGHDFYGIAQIETNESEL